MKTTKTSVDKNEKESERQPASNNGKGSEAKEQRPEMRPERIANSDTCCMNDVHKRTTITHKQRVPRRQINSFTMQALQLATRNVPNAFA